MKATPLLKMSDQEVHFIINTSITFRENLESQEKDMFDIGFSKVVHSRKYTELDSMEMMMISKALKKISIELFEKYGKNGMRKTRQTLINLAHVIDFERINHQMKHHPLKKKKLTA
ncbi:hypothetical protein [Salipaludibacillus sp. CF4.18]|uniref:hypothetical protein n=1 Tax=Salipaludibacillus sp. CF4.18 TaxID=3373081 RepID=UPI003EE7BCDD